MARNLRIEFTARGGDYFRLWQLNLLLTLLSLGFCRPFAKARKLRYFAASTRIGGHALAFDGDPWRMLGGHCVMLLLFGAYAASGYVSAAWSLGLLAVLALLWPGLWRAGLRYRLAHTRWRGLRFGFAGSLAGAYRAQLLWMLPPLVLALFTVLLAPDTTPGELPELPALAWWALLALTAVCLPLGLARVKRYQMAGYRFADQRVLCELDAKGFFGMAAATFGYALLALLTVALASGIAAMVLSPWLGGGSVSKVGYLLGFSLGYLVVLVAAGAYLAARVQNEVWNGSRSHGLQVRSALAAGDFVRLVLRNWLLIALSLGLFRPWATVGERRMRWAAVDLVAHTEPNGWRTAALAHGVGSSGEMSGDFFGLDLGW